MTSTSTMTISHYMIYLNAGRNKPSTVRSYRGGIRTSLRLQCRVCSRTICLILFGWVLKYFTNKHPLNSTIFRSIVYPRCTWANNNQYCNQNCNTIYFVSLNTSIIPTIPIWPTYASYLEKLSSNHISSSTMTYRPTNRTSWSTPTNITQEPCPNAKGSLWWSEP